MKGARADHWQQLDNLACRMSFRQLLRTNKEACAVAHKRNEVLQLGQKGKKELKIKHKRKSPFLVFFLWRN